MNPPKRSNSKEKGSSPASFLLTPPDSAGEPFTSPQPSPSHTSLSQPAQCAIQIIKSVKQHGRSKSPWIKLRLEDGDFSLLKKRLKDDDLWGYVQDKIRFDYDPQTYLLIFRMPSCTHDIFTFKINIEIERQLQLLRLDTSRPHVAALAKSIQCCSTSDIQLLSNPDRDYSLHSPDTSFQHIDAGFPHVIIETSYSQKKKDLPRLADDYVFGSDGNIKLVIGLDIEYRNSKRATVSVWESKEGIEDGVPYLCVEKTVNDKPFRNDDSSPVASDSALIIPLSIFVIPDDASLLFSPDTAISIPYTALFSILKDAEYFHQQRERETGENPRGFIKRQPPGTRRKMRQITPEE